MNTWLSAHVCRPVIVCAMLVGCAGAEWQQVRVSPAYQPPKVITVAVAVRTDATVDKDALEALQSALTQELAEHGIKATFVPAPIGPPEADITVVEWDPGSRAMRWFFGFGSGKGQILLMVKSPSADGQPGVEGAAHGWVSDGWFGGSANASAEEAGHLIGHTIATGKAHD